MGVVEEKGEWIVGFFGGLKMKWDIEKKKKQVSSENIKEKSGKVGIEIFN